MEITAKIELTEEQKKQLVIEEVEKYRDALNWLTLKPFDKLTQEQKNTLMELHGVFKGLEKRWKEVQQIQTKFIKE